MNLVEAFPTYLEMRNPLPRWVWQAASGFAVSAAFGLVALCFVAPRVGLIVWWLWILPVLPLSWMLAPGIWRNICPMAMLNQLPRLFAFTRARTVPRWLRDHALLVQTAMYFALISTRAPLFDHNGRGGLAGLSRAGAWRAVRGGDHARRRGGVDE